MMKNAFYFALKALFVLKIFNFFLIFWSCRKNGLIRNIKLFSKFVTSKPDSQTRAISHNCPISHEIKPTRHEIGKLTEFFKIFAEMR